MVVPTVYLSQLTSTIVKAVQNARADLLATDLIQTDGFEISFQANVIDDTRDEITNGGTEQVQPETTQTSTQGPAKSVQTSVREAQETTETQVSTPGVAKTTQNFGRSSIVENEFIE